MVGFFVANTGVVADVLAYPATPPYQNKNTPIRGYFYFWWEWLDSNQLRLKPTDLQSAPALQLRRTPELNRHMLLFVACHTKLWRSVVRAAGIEPAFQAWKACILAFVLCPQQIQSPTII